MAEAGADEVAALVDTILEEGQPHFGQHLKMPEAVANKAIKTAASKLEREEMAASPTHEMKGREEGGLACAVQEVSKHTARPDMNPVVAAVQDRVRQMAAQQQDME